MMLFTPGISSRQESVDTPRKTVTSSTRGMVDLAVTAAAAAAVVVLFLVTLDLVPSQGAGRIEDVTTTTSFIEQQQPEVSLYLPRFEKMEHEYYPPSASI